MTDSVPYVLLHASGFTSYPITHTEKYETAWNVLALRSLSCPSIELIKEEGCDRSKKIMLIRCRSMQILYHCKCLWARDVCFENHLRREKKKKKKIISEKVAWILQPGELLCMRLLFAYKWHMAIMRSCKASHLPNNTSTAANVRRERSFSTWIHRCECLDIS